MLPGILIFTCSLSWKGWLALTDPVRSEGLSVFHMGLCGQGEESRTFQQSQKLIHLGFLGGQVRTQEHPYTSPPSVAQEPPVGKQK